MEDIRPPRRGRGVDESDRRMPHEPDLVDRIDMWLGALGSARVRVSLFRLAVPPAAIGSALGALEAGLGTSGFVGRLPDGTIGIFHCGPRPAKDAALEESVSRRVRAALGVALPAPPGDLQISAVHAWAQEIDSAADLIALARL